MKICFAMVVASASIGAFGATTQADCTDYLETSDTSYDLSSLLFGTNWHSGDAPTTSSTNYIGSGLTLYGPTTAALSAHPFGGGCFVLAGSIVMNKGIISWPELRLEDNASYSWSSASALNGRVVVESSAASPAKITMFYGNGFLTTVMNASFSGAADTGLRLQRSSSGPPKVPSPDQACYMYGDWSGFNGTVTVATNTAIAFQSNATVGNKIVPGKVVVERGGYWYGLICFGFTSVYTQVGSLDMQDGSHFWAKCDSEGRASLVVVTNELVLGRDVDVKFKASWSGTGGPDAPLPPYSAGGEAKVPLFRLKGAAADRVPDLTGCILPDYPEGSKIGGLLPRYKDLVCRTNNDGSKTIYAVYHDRIDWTMNKANTQNGWGDTALNPANTSYWVDGSMPSSDSVGTMLSTAALELFAETSGASVSYPGVTLIANSTVFLYATTEMENIILPTGITVFAHRGPSTKRLRGKLTLLSGTSKLFGYIGSTLHLDAEILGDGALSFQSDANANPKAYFYLGGTNVNFHGKFISTWSFNSDKFGPYPDPSKDWYATIYLKDGRNLGGTYSGEDAWAAFTVGAWTKLKIASSVSSVTLDEPTRGIFVTKGCAQVELSEGQTLTVKEPITYGGELRKLGAGCLALGGEARFIDGDPATEPLEGTNRLAVCAGTLKILSTNAVNGVQIEMSEGASIVVDAGSEAEGMSEFGFVNTRWATPFVPAAADAPIPVKVCGLADGATAAVPICTVSSAAARGLSFKVARIPRCRANVVQRANADGTVTFVADVKPTGACLVIR